MEDDGATERHDLEPKHKVFLSHSNADKDFVEQLCIDLERWDRYPFFDKRRRCLPVGRTFPELLFRAIRQCEVGVVVLSEEFFTRSKWPMLELVLMVRESKRRGAGMRIVPVFLRISREECHNPERQDRWAARWKEWAAMDCRIDLEKWKQALAVFRSTMGVRWRDGEVDVRREVVDAVCKLVAPETRWDDSNVEGKERLCEVIFQKAGLEVEDPGVRCHVVGVHGVGGIGKTTVCKMLCNKLYPEFRGRVWHGELKSASEVELLRGALKVVTDTSHDLLEKMNLDQCKDHLKRRRVRQRVFLAIDNVDEESAEQAKAYLQAAYCVGNGSLVVVTARSMNLLRALNIREDACSEMPELEEVEARRLFLNHAASIDGVGQNLHEGIVGRCVERCRFGKSDGRGTHYHPLALKVLGNELSERMACNDLDGNGWSSRFWESEESEELLGAEKQVFSILRRSYDTSEHEDQMLFVDVALFLRSFDHDGINLLELLAMVHGGGRRGALRKGLERLKRKSLLEEVGDGWRHVGMHDLWREFCVA